LGEDKFPSGYRHVLGGQKGVAPTRDAAVGGSRVQKADLQARKKKGIDFRPASEFAGEGDFTFATVTGIIWRPEKEWEGKGLQLYSPSTFLKKSATKNRIRRRTHFLGFSGRLQSKRDRIGETAGIKGKTSGRCGRITRIDHERSDKVRKLWVNVLLSKGGVILSAGPWSRRKSGMLLYRSRKTENLMRVRTTGEGRGPSQEKVSERR